MADVEYVHAWAGGGYPKTGPVPGYTDLNYSQMRLYQHVCGHVEEWSTAVGPIDEEGCDACESAPNPGSWQPLYRKADSYQGHPRSIERESVADALENDRCGICGSVDHFREDCPS